MRSKSCWWRARGWTAALPKLAHLIAAAAVATLAVPAGAQMQPASAESLGTAVGTCLSAVESDGTIVSALEARGWSRARIDNGGEAADEIMLFGMAGNEALILTSEAGEDGRAPCIVLARLPRTSAYHPTAEALSQIIGMPTERNENQYFWRFSDKIAQMTPSGSAEAPSLRFVVMQSGDN